MSPVQSRRVAELDSLRAIMALVVVFHHVFKIFHAKFEEFCPPWAFFLADTIQAQNHRAVMAFFVLSGFTIAMATQECPPITPLAARHYLWRRATRVIPLYYMALAWTAALGLVYGIGHPHFSIRTLVGNALFLQTSASGKGNWFAPYGLNGPFWSLSYEVFYYLALPLVLWVLRKRRPWSSHAGGDFVLVGLGAMATGLAVGIVAPSPFSAFATLWIVWIVGYVAFGMAPGISTFLIVALPAVVAVTVEALLAQAGYMSASLSGAREGAVIAFVFAVVVIWRGWTKIAAVKRLRSVFNATFERIGRGSYALYLLHYPLLLTVQAVLIKFGHATLIWISLSLLYTLFIIFFCPWVECVSIRPFRNTCRPRIIANLTGCASKTVGPY